MSFHHLKFILLISFICVSLKHKAQSPPADISISLQGILDNAIPVGITNSGVVMSVLAPGQWSWSGSSGSAISGMDPLYPETMTTPQTKFRVGSITKTFVASCIMLLEEQGMLTIEDPISYYLSPSLVNDTIMSSGIIKIRHLLNHTSGIANSADNLSCQGDVLNAPLTPYSFEDAVFCGASQGEMFPPEFTWGYSNTNYTLLAMIIEQVSGVSYSNFLTQNIIEPLELIHTEIPENSILDGDYMGCYWNIGDWIDLSIIHPSIYRGWADIVSNSSDLNRFYSNLLDGNVVSNNSLLKMKTIDPASFDYGLGIDFYELGGDAYFGHSGEVANSSSMFYSDLSSGLTPNGYYISFNFNVQGVDMSNLIDVPVYNLLNQNSSNTTDIKGDIPGLIVYPNPANAFVNIDCAIINAKYTLCNTLGIVLCEGQIMDRYLTLNTLTYASGVYFLTINAGGYSEVINLTIEK